MRHWRLLLGVLALAVANEAVCQGFWRRASTDEMGRIQLQSMDRADPPVETRDDLFTQQAGFPRVAVANKVFKNFRNVTLVELDGRPGQEILWVADGQLMATAFDTTLWTKELAGIGIYPPSVADLDGDGQPEIVQVTGGNETGRVYVLDASGNDLPGWPLNFDDNWIAAAPCLADVDDDGQLEIIVNELQATDGLVHLLRPDGRPFSPAWPVRLDARPAVTPSVGDVDGDGSLEIVAFSTHSRYVLGLDGQPLPGWPQTTHPMQRYSFQSPILAELRAGEGLSVVGATHGQGDEAAPYIYALDGAGRFREGWPFLLPEATSTFNTPTVVDLPEHGPVLFASRPLGSEGESDMLYALNADGQNLPGFPLVKNGGLEGMISMADADGDGAADLIFGSNLVDEEQNGFLHAYSLDPTGPAELPGFPLRTRGFTFMNGATLGDVDGDDRLDLVALSFVQRFGLGEDSLYLNVFELKVPIQAGTILWGTYKGSNTRQGLAGKELSTALELPDPILDVTLSPNPADDYLRVDLQLLRPRPLHLRLIDPSGKHVLARRLQGQAGPVQERIPLNNLPAGTYWISIGTGGKTWQTLPFIRR